MDSCNQVYRLLVIGKTGNGKSTLCNTIFGRDKFQTGCSMVQTTIETQTADTTRTGKQIEVMEAPDLVNLGASRTKIEGEVKNWTNFVAQADKAAILLAVRCDVRYTAEEFDIYKKIKDLWADNTFCSRLVVAFTFADRLDVDVEEQLRSSSCPPELKNVAEDARRRYVLFNNQSYDKTEQVTTLLHTVDSMPKCSQPRNNRQIEREPSRALVERQQGTSQSWLCPFKCAVQ